MSVPAWNRDVNLSAILDKAAELLTYAVKLSGSAKAFPQRHKFDLALPIVDQCRTILHLTAVAERRKGGAQSTDIQDRIQCLRSALDAEAKLNIELNINLRSFFLKANAAKHFDDLISEWHNLCMAAIRADVTKLKGL